jgi:AcrR family transcriptional regulator
MSRKEPPQAQPGRPRDDQLDTAIRRATLELLAEAGYARVTIAEVARRASTVPPTIYRRHRGVKDLVLAALDAELASLAGFAPDAGSVRKDLFAYVRKIADMLDPQRASIMAGLLVPMRQDRALGELMREGMEAVIASNWGAIMDRAIRRGELDPKARTLGVLSRVASAVVFQRTTLLQLAVDDPFVSELVDTVLLPALGPHLARRPASQRR